MPALPSIVTARAGVAGQAAQARTVTRLNGTVELWISLPRNRWTKWARARLADYLSRADKADVVVVEYPTLFRGHLKTKTIKGRLSWRVLPNGEVEWRA